MKTPKTVEEYLAMTEEEIAGLTTGEKILRTKTINAAKPATPGSGDLASSLIEKAKAEKGQGAAKPATPGSGDLGTGNNTPIIPIAGVQHTPAQPGADNALNEDNGHGATGNANTGQGEKENILETPEQIKARLDAEQAEADALAEKALIDRYGEGYIKASHSDGRKTIFSAIAWAGLEKNKDGWRPEAKEPAEITEFKKQKGGN